MTEKKRLTIRIKKPVLKKISFKKLSWKRIPEAERKISRL